jgi:hypothetical protein
MEPDYSMQVVLIRIAADNQKIVTKIKILFNWKVHLLA